MDACSDRKSHADTHLDRVVRPEGELKPIFLALIYGVLVQDNNVHKPCLEVICLDQCDAWRELVLHLMSI